MTSKHRKRIPVNIIGGSLGVGKTTTINHLLTQRPSHEKWAILVNEYGLVGLDAALLHQKSNATEQNGVEIKEVAGGCICCSAGFMFKVSLVMLLQCRPDRLLIEPTGLAALSGILDTLDQPGIRDSVDIQSIICLMDPTRLTESLEREEMQDQIEAADIVLANRSDVASKEQLKSFEEWATNLFPKKKLVHHIENGEIPIDYLHMVSQREKDLIRGNHTHDTDHDHHKQHIEQDINCDESQPIVRRVHLSPKISTVGWICWNEIIFDAERISNWLRNLSQLSNIYRTKAVVRTTKGWWGVNFIHDTKEIHPNGYRRDSRIEIILEGDQIPDIDMLEVQLHNCITSNINQ